MPTGIEDEYKQIKNCGVPAWLGFLGTVHDIVLNVIQ